MSNSTTTAAPSAPARFFVGQELSDRSACDHDCIFRGTVIKRTAKRVTLDLGRGEIKTVGIFIDYRGNEACFPFGRYSMASIFSAGDKNIPEAAPVAAPVVEAKPEFTQAQVETAARECVGLLMEAGWEAADLRQLSPERIDREVRAVLARRAFRIV